VRVELIVRDTCRLRPGIPGLSDNISVISIVGRFLEHTRVYFFRNGGEEEYYIGSADCMKRNLEHRVETLVPVDDPDLRQQLREMLEIQLYDHRSAWDMQPDGSYVQRQPRKEKEQRGSHDRLIRATAKLARDARKPGKGKPRPVRKVGRNRP
jgi:polyphosphate kinase